MKLYVTTYIDDAAAEESGNEFGHQWYGTQADQKKAAKQLHSEGMRNIETEQVDVPTDKPGLLAWLNEREVRP